MRAARASATIAAIVFLEAAPLHTAGDLLLLILLMRFFDRAALRSIAFCRVPIGARIRRSGTKEG